MGVRQPARLTLVIDRPGAPSLELAGVDELSTLRAILDAVERKLHDLDEPRTTVWHVELRRTLMACDGGPAVKLGGFHN